MKILIIGGAGFIGASVANFIKKAGHQVVVVDDLSTGSRDFLLPEITFIHGDARDEQFLTSVMTKEQFAGVILLAAKIKVGESMEMPWLYFHDNISLLNNTLKVMKITQTNNFIFSSSGSIYGNNAIVPIKEEAAFDPQSVYAQTKVIAEQIISWYQKLNIINCVVFRYFNAAGSDGLSGMIPPLSHIIPIISEVALGKRDELVIFGGDYPTKDGTCIRDYVHVADLANAHLLALLKMNDGTIKNETFNLGKEIPASVLDIVNTYMKLGYPINYRIGPRRPNNADAISQYASSKKAQDILGWKAEKSLEDMIMSDLHFRAKL